LPPFRFTTLFTTQYSFYYLLLLLRHYYYYFKKRMKKFCRKEVHGGAGKQWDAVWIHSKNEKVGFRPDNSRSSGINEGQWSRNGSHCGAALRPPSSLATPAKFRLATLRQADVIEFIGDS
jgi:hypothetical protein